MLYINIYDNIKGAIEHQAKTRLQTCVRQNSANFILFFDRNEVDLMYIICKKKTTIFSILAKFPLMLPIKIQLNRFTSTY
jgi:hypothetical protein